MLPLPTPGRLLVLFFVLAAPAALAQTAPSPYIDKDASTTYEADALVQEPSLEIDAAVADAMRASSNAMADSTAPEALEDLMREMEAAIAQSENGEIPAGMEAEMENVVTELASGMAQMMGAMFGLSDEELAEMGEQVRTEGTMTRTVSQEAAAPRSTNRLYRRASVQSYPVIPNGYGMDGDGYPDRMAISGTIVAAGSLRICRFDAPPVSRWLRIRLSDTSATYPGEQIVVAVQCHEDKKELLVGRRVRMEVWKSIASRPIRMATDDVPSVGTPMYESYPGNVRLGG
ncbi:hypothetical protein [Rubricoccus marinus]|uniref:Uncharacterized protein n=1 Tax=Rubricoccus marinus TaxID=716817 RepID=A0A259TWT0_9BACT|nr:hypothetical protein [Rubricoccus marinus]OZC02232.1 hypothetical protein BSZ36_04055 [Rubricoccus marinus]